MYTFQDMHIPDHMMESIKDYIEYGVPVDGFLEAVICHDLFEAVARADGMNIRNLPAYVSYFCDEAPGMCHGSHETMLKWIARFQTVATQEEQSDGE